MRSWRYLVLALLSGGVLAPLGLALTLRRARLWRVSAACLGGLALFALMWAQPYLWSSLLWLAGLAGLQVLAVGEERDPRAWGRAALLVLGQVLLGLGLGLALAAAGWL
ncbi:competence protein, partial [Calidithermus terrae]|uniref:competence protein n=1 Tax=Calidithermus terrae TaxID=1408545 RepID=UPI000E648BE6